MAKAGTLPAAAYQSVLQPSNSALEDPFEDEEMAENEARGDNDNEGLDFDVDSNSNIESVMKKRIQGFSRLKLAEKHLF